MSSIFWKNFYVCFSKIIKCDPEAFPPPSPSSTKHHQNHSLPINLTFPTTISSSSSSSTLIKNFNSLYEQTSSDSTYDHFSSSSTETPSDTDTDTDPPPDIAAVFASQRFFFSSPGRSNSIVDSPHSSSPDSAEFLTGGIAVQTLSPDPYSDFQKSMEEMIEARGWMDVKANWDYLHELLLCYLTLNPRNTHKFIVSAFTDLLISLMARKGNADLW